MAWNQKWAPQGWSGQGKGKGSSSGESWHPQGWSSTAKGSGSSQGSGSSWWEGDSASWWSDPKGTGKGGWSSWWRDPNEGTGSGSSSWWRDPNEGTGQSSVQEAMDEARSLADDNYQNARVGAIEEHGLPLAPGSFFGGRRQGWHVWNYPQPGQQRGISGAKHEKYRTHHVYTVHVPVSIKEAGYWWTEVKELAKEYELKVSYRPMRYNPTGPGWNSLHVTGPGGGDFLEEILRMLLQWRPDFDIYAVALPELGDEFPLQEVKDALGNVKEWIIRPGVTLIDAKNMTVRVAGYGDPERFDTVPLVILRDARKRRKTSHLKTEQSGLRGSSASSEPRGSSASEIRGPSSASGLRDPSTVRGSSIDTSSAQDTSMRDAASPPPAEDEPAAPPAGVTAEDAPAPAGVTAEDAPSSGATVPHAGFQLKKIDFSKRSVKIPISKLPGAKMTLTGSVEDLPPFYNESLEQLEKLRAQQKLTTVLGVEQVKLAGVPELPDPDVKVAYCSTAFKRPTVAMALVINLALTWKRRRNITWHVVDFNPDTNLSTHLLEVLGEAVRCGHLKLYRSDGLEFWHACVAKNTAHMVADDSYHVLCNVDGDNLLTLDFVEQSLAVAARVKSGEVACAQFYGSGEAGTYGRIMIDRTLFSKLGGYDESFHPVGCQDTDLIYRVLACSGVGDTIRVDTNAMVGSSIDNKPGATWSQCIQEKVANTDPSKYSRWKFGFMDSENRTKMYELLEAGVVQRNVGKVIGCKTTLFKFKDEPSSNKEDEEEEESPNWGGSPPPSPRSSVLSGGVTPKSDEEEEEPPAGGVTPTLKFKIATFGLEKLAHLSKWKNLAANELYAAWFPSKGKAPVPIAKNLIINAVKDSFGVPDVFIDARCFKPPPRDWTDSHMVFHMN